MPPKSNTYSSQQIKQLTPREHIRLRPGMYIGGTDKRALHHMVYEVLDNAVEEVMLGQCNRITITLRANQTVTIDDNSAGLPIEETDAPFYPHYLHMRPSSKSMKKPYIEFIMTDFASKPTFSGNYYGEINSEINWRGLSHA